MPELTLSPQQRKVFDVIRRAGDNGIDSAAVIEHMYIGCVVPPTAHKVMHVAVWWINKRLHPHGLRIKGKSLGRAQMGHYVLKEIRA